MFIFSYPWIVTHLIKQREKNVFHVLAPDKVRFTFPSVNVSVVASSNQTVLTVNIYIYSYSLVA